MEQKLDRLEDKLDSIVQSQALIKADLQEHMRRTIIAEDNIERLALAMAPVQEHVAFIRGFGKFLTIAGTVIAGLAALWQVFFNK